MERQRRMITIADILSPKHILVGLKAETRARALSKVADLLERDERLTDWDQFYNGIMAGAACITNDFGAGICIAHVRSKAVHEMVMAVAQSPGGILFEESGVRIHLIVVIGVPLALASDYLRIIGALARIFRTEKGEAALLGASTPQELLERLCALEMQI
jgi:mannitol/fructose-specific phosphotransferase system IIA component (Ntr-type)